MLLCANVIVCQYYCVSMLLWANFTVLLCGKYYGLSVKMLFFLSIALRPSYLPLGLKNRT